MVLSSLSVAPDADVGPGALSVGSSIAAVACWYLFLMVVGMGRGQGLEVLSGEGVIPYVRNNKEKGSRVLRT